MLGGAYLLTTKGQTLLPRIGDLYILAACVCWSLGTVLVKKALNSQSISPDVITLQKPIAGLSVFIIMIGISIYVPESLGKLDDVLACCSFAPRYYPYVLGSGVSLAITWIFLLRTLAVSTASYMTLMSMITPVIVSILAILFLGETFIWVQTIGVGMIFFSAVTIYFSDIAHS